MPPRDTDAPGTPRAVVQMDAQGLEALVELLRGARASIRGRPDDAERLLDGCLRVFEHELATHRHAAAASANDAASNDEATE